MHRVVPYLYCFQSSLVNSFSLLNVYLFVSKKGGGHSGGELVVAHLVLPDSNARLQLVEIPLQFGGIEYLLPQPWVFYEEGGIGVPSGQVVPNKA